MEKSTLLGTYIGTYPKVCALALTRTQKIKEAELPEDVVEMTTKDKLKSLLVERGVFEEDAEAVLKEAIPRIEGLVPNYQITWNRPADEYPPQLYVAWWMELKTVARSWIAKNTPNAWFRSMFD